jgi:hypothetical protein
MPGVIATVAELSESESSIYAILVPSVVQSLIRFGCGSSAPGFFAN